MMDEGGGVREEGERLSVTEEGSGGELGSDLDLDPDPDPEPWKFFDILIRKMMWILWILILIRNTAVKASTSSMKEKI